MTLINMSKVRYASPVSGIYRRGMCELIWNEWIEENSVLNDSLNMKENMMFEMKNPLELNCMYS